MRNSVQIAILATCFAFANAGILLQHAPACPERYGVQAYAHPELCDQFFLCTNGTLTVETCENGLLFDGKGAVHNHCNYHWAVDCGERKADLTPYSSPGCEYQFGIYPDSNECSTSYVKCEYGYPHQEPCTPGLVYDERIHGCNWPDLLQPFCNPEANAGILLQHAPACPERYGVQAYAHPELCDQFFLCTNGTLTVETCENGLLFDGKGAVHNHCNYHWAVDCGERKADLTPYSSPGCEYQFGIYPDSNECSTSYVKCEYGYPHQEPCTPGLVYDERIHGCNWPDLLQPFCNPEAVIGFKCPAKVPANTPAAKFWPFPRFPVPGDCHRLITCVEGQPRLITCGEGKVFDEQNLTCEDPELVPHCA